jgi:hypothetical protein
MSKSLDPVLAISAEQVPKYDRRGSVETMESMDVVSSSKDLIDSGKITDDLESGKELDYQLNMWHMDHIGLYCHYAAGGLLYGTAGTLSTFCVYVYGGAPNVCANAGNLMFFPWSFKILFAIMTETIRPFGLRRKPWMIGGYVGVLLILAVLIGSGDSISATNWLTSLLLMQCTFMVANVAADGN